MRSQTRPIPHTVRLISYILIIALLATILPASALARAKKTPNGMYAGTYPYNFYFAEGCTREGFTEYLTLSNPSSANADIEVTYLFPSKQGFSKDYLLQAGSRRTLNINEELSFSEEDVSLIVRSASPFVAERPMYFNFSGYFDGTDLVGLTSPRTSFYFAEGTTRSGFEEWLCLMNPNEEEARVKATFLDSTGAPTERELTVSPYSRQTLKVSEVTGPEKDVSAVVQSDKPVACERVQYFSFRGFSGGHVSSGVSEPTTSFGLAEGTTRSGYEEWLTLLNPSFEPADATLTYMFPDGNAQVVHHTIPPASRYTINAASDVGPEKDVSCFISSEIPLVGERPMYFNTGKYQGGHVGVGLPTSSKTFFFAEGTTQEGFDEYLCVENPDAKPTHARIDYLVDGSANQFQELDLLPRSRTTIPIHAILGRGTDHGLVLTAEKPVLAERPIYYYRTDIQGGDISGGLASQGPSAFSITPASLEIQPGESSQFASDVRDVCGYPVPSTVTWGIDGGIGTIEQNGLFTAGGSDSAGNIWARAWNLSANAAVTVGNGPTSLTASIDSPSEGSFQRSVFEIKGTASGSSFASYDLSYAPASSPTSFTTIKSSKTPIQGSPLASWDTTGIPDGSYILRLIVHPARGDPQEARRNLTVDNTPPVASIDSPVGTELLTGEVAITGTAQDANIESYSLEKNEEETSLLCRFDNSPTDAIDGSNPRNSSITSFEVSRFGQAVYLDEGARLDYDAAGHIDKDQGTIEMWVNPRWEEGDQQSRVLLSTSPPEGQGGNALMLIRIPGFLYLVAGDEDGGYRMVGYPLGENDLKPGQWSHVAATWNRGELNVYLNGKPPTSPERVDEGTGMISEVGDLIMVGYYPRATTTANMAADELVVFKEERTPEEIEADFNAGSPAGPGQYDSFLTVSGTGVSQAELGSWNTNGTVDGGASLRLLVEDKAGNVSYASRRVSVDNNLPEVRIDRPEPDGSVWGNYQVTGEAYDASLDSYDLSYESQSDPGVWHQIVTGEKKWVCPGVLANWDVSGLPTGNYTLKVTARDGLGRESSATRQTIVDNEPPTTSITSPSEGQIVGGTTDVTGTASDLNFLDYSLDCMPTGLTFLAHYDQDTKDEVSGSEGELSGQALYEQARYSSGMKLAPDSGLSYPAEGVLSPEEGTVEFWVKPGDWPLEEEIVHPLFVVEPTGQGNENLLLLYHTVVSGRHCIAMSAFGDHGLSGWLRELEPSELEAPLHVAFVWKPGALDLYVNGVKAERSVNNPEMPTSLGSRFFVGAFLPEGEEQWYPANALTDELSIWSRAKSEAEIISDLGADAPGIARRAIVSSSTTPVENGLLARWDTSGIPDGLYDLALTARQMGGFMSSAKRQVRVDNDAPTALIETPQDGSSTGGQVKVNGTALDSSIDRYRLEYALEGDPENWQPVTEVAGENRVSRLLGTWDTGSLAEGGYLLRLVVTDQSGKSSESLVTLAIENGPPTAEITSPANGSAASGQAQVEGTASDASFRDYSLDLRPRGLSFGAHFEQDLEDFTGGEPGAAVGGTSYQPGKYGTGIHIPNDSYVTFRNGRDIDRDEGTFEAWVTPDWSGTDQSNHLILAAEYFESRLSLEAGYGKVQFRIRNEAGDKTCGKYVTDEEIKAGVPFHVAATWDSGVMHLYVNGVGEDEVSGSGTGVLSEDIETVNLGGIDSYHFMGNLNGTLDEVVFLDYDRSIADIEQDAHARAARSAPFAVADHVTNPVVAGMLGSFESDSLPDGDYSLDLTCSDTYGNRSESEVIVTLDNLPPVAEIAAPSEDEVKEGAISIRGSAWDEAFTRYVLEWGEGENPTIWNPIGGEHTTLVYEGTLDTWDTAGLPDGVYTIRLTVQGLSEYHADRHVVLDSSDPEVQIASPASDELVSGICPVTGTAQDEHFASYTLSYTEGTIPGPWGFWNEISSGTSPVLNGELGTWDTSGLADGTYTLLLKATDALGHENEIRVYVGVNNLVPEVAISDPLQSETLSASERIRGTAKDMWFESYSLFYAPGWGEHLPEDWVQIGIVHDVEVENDLLETWDTTTVPQGEYTLKLDVRDEGGIPNSAEVHVETTTRPSADISNPRAGQARSGQIEIRGTASNPDFHSYYVDYAPGNPEDGSPDWVRLVGETFTPVEDGVLGNWDTGALNGTYTLRLTVTGSFEHENRTRVTFEIDNTDPTVSITSPTPSELLSPMYEIRGTASDDHFGSYRLEYEKEDRPGEWRLIGSTHYTAVQNGKLETLDTASLPSGIYTLRLTATDSCSNENTVSVPFEVDTDDPVVGIEAPAPDAVISGQATIHGTAADPHFGSYSLYYSPSYQYQWQPAGGPNTSPVSDGDLGTWNTSTIPDGAYDINLVAVDAVGNDAAATVFGVRIDNTNCAAVITSPNPDFLEVKTGHVEIRGTASDQNFDHYTLEYSTASDPGTWNPIGGDYLTQVYDGTLADWDSAAVAQDVCTIKLTVCDRAGHQKQAETTVEIDNQDPDITVNSPLPSTFYSGTLTVTGTVKDNNFDSASVSIASGATPGGDDFETLRTIPVSVENAELASIDTRQFQDGDVTLRIEASDKLGHQKVTNLAFMVDNSDPQASITSPEQGESINGQLVIRGTASDRYLDEYVVQFAQGDNPEPGATWTNVAPASSEKVRGGILAVWDTGGVVDGPYTLRLVATDIADRTSVTSTSLRLASATVEDPSVNIENGAAFCRRREVTLTLACTDAKMVQVSNDGASYSDPEPFSPKKTWVLPADDGQKIVYVKYKDTSGWLPPVHDEIDLDTHAPADTRITSPAPRDTISDTVQITAAAEDPEPVPSGIEHAEFFYSLAGSPLISIGKDTTPEELSTTLDTSTIGYGYYDLFVRVYDRAGNSTLSSPVSVRHLDDEGTWPTTGHDNANTRFNSKFNAQEYWYEQVWPNFYGNPGHEIKYADEYDEEKFQPISATTIDGDTQKHYLFQIKHVRKYEWGWCTNEYKKVVRINADDPWGEPVGMCKMEEEELTVLPISVSSGMLYMINRHSIREQPVTEIQGTHIYQNYWLSDQEFEKITGGLTFISDNVALIPSEHKLRAVVFDGDGGELQELWRVSVEGAKTPAIIGEGDERVIVFTTGQGLYFVKVSDDQPVVERFVEGGYSGTPVLSNNMAYVYGTGGVAAFRLSDYEQVWSQAGGYSDRFAVAYNMVYLVQAQTSDITYVDARDATTGALVWRRKLEGFSEGENNACRNPVRAGAPAVGNGKVFIAAGQAVGLFDRTQTYLFTFDAFAGFDVVPPFNWVLAGLWSTYTDYSVVLAFNSIYLNWNSTALVRLDPVAPKQLNRGLDNYCGFYDEINTANGSYTLSEEDFKIPTRGLPLEFKRSYSSHRIDETYKQVSPEIPEDGPLGPGWSFNYGMRLEIGESWVSGQVVNLVQEDGSVYPFTFKTGDKAEPAPGVFDKLERREKSPDSDEHIYTLTRKDHSVYEFEEIDTSGGKLEDPKQKVARLSWMCNDPTRLDTNKTCLFYEQAPDHPLRVTKVVEPGAERWISFEYYPDSDDHCNGKIKRVDGPGDADLNFTYEYNENGKMTRSTFTDQDTNTTAYSYRGKDLKLNGICDITDPAGGIVHINYEEEAMTDGDVLLRVVDTHDQMGKITRYDYSLLNKTTVVTDPEGRTTVHRHDATERLTQEIDPEGGSTMYSYGPDGTGRTVRDKNRNLTTYEMKLKDGKSTGDVAKITDARGCATSFTYDDNGMVTSVAGPRGDWTCFYYENPGHPYDLTRKLDPYLFETTYQYGAEGYGKPTEIHRKVDLEDPEVERAELYLYNARGEKTSESRRPEDTWVCVGQYLYDDCGRVVRKTDGRGRYYFYEYNSSGKQKREVDPLNKDTKTEYDSRGNKVKFTDKLGHVTTYEYDSCNRPTKTTTMRAGTQEEPLYTEETSYTDAGNVASKTDRNGHVTANVNDGAGRPVRVTDPLGKATETEYDPNGNVLKRRTDGYGEESYAYNEIGKPVTYINSEEEETRMTYDEAGNKISETKVLEDGSLSSTTYAYDLCNRQTTKTEPPDEAGRRPVTTTDYYGSGEKRQVTDPEGHIADYAYDGAGRLLGETLHDDLEDRTISYSGYDGNGNPHAMTDANGNERALTYDDMNRLTLVEMTSPPSGELAAFSYDAAGNRTLETSGTGVEQRKTETLYDELNRAVEVRKYHSETEYYATTTAYDGMGNKTAVTDARDITTTYTYDASNRLIEKSEPPTESGDPRRVTGYRYDDSARLLIETDPRDADTVHSFDRLGREVYRGGPSGEQKIIQYNNLGKPAAVYTRYSDTGFETITNTYDLLGRLTETVAPGGFIKSYGYDLEGNRTAEADEEGNTTTFTYNALGKPTSKSEPYSGGAHTTSYTYDPNGNKTKETDGAGRAVEYRYDSLNRLYEVVTDPDDGNLELTTTYAYDSCGNLRGVTDPRRNQVLTMDFDRLGRVVSEADAQGNTYTYSYDEAGNLTNTVLPGTAGTITRTYNASNLISSFDAPGEAADTIYTYDQNLNESLLSNNSGDYTLAFSYDDSNRLETLTSELEGTPELGSSQSFTYDPRGDLTSASLGHTTQSYSYDERGNLSSVSDTSSGASYTLTYAPDRQLKEISMPGGMKTSYDYYENNLPRTITTKRPDDEECAFFDYTYEEGNLPRTVRSYVEDNPASATYTYTYDDAGRLLTSESSLPFTENITYAYDASGNMTEKAVSGTPAITYTYDTDNRLSSDSEGNRYAYDERGNLSEVYTDPHEVQKSYTYDALDRMSAATVSGKEISYTYDPLSRMTKRDSEGALSYIRMKGTSDDPVLMMEPGSWTSFIRTPEGRLLGTYDAGGTLNSVGSNAHTDICFSIDTAGSITSSSLYRPFGEKQATTGTPQPLGYQGDLTDPDTGLVDMGDRLYSPEFSRFMTEDPVDPKPTDPESYNPYLYTDDAPLGRMDPDGRSWWNPFSWFSSGGYASYFTRSLFGVVGSIFQVVRGYVSRPVFNTVRNQQRNTARTLGGSGLFGSAAITCFKTFSRLLGGGQVEAKPPQKPEKKRSWWDKLKDGFKTLGRWMEKGFYAVGLGAVVEGTKAVIAGVKSGSIWRWLRTTGMKVIGFAMNVAALVISVASVLAAVPTGGQSLWFLAVSYSLSVAGSNLYSLGQYNAGEISLKDAQFQTTNWNWSLGIGESIPIFGWQISLQNLLFEAQHMTD